jgi:hypothetical protein
VSPMVVMDHRRGNPFRRRKVFLVLFYFSIVPNFERVQVLGNEWREQSIWIVMRRVGIGISLRV